MELVILILPAALISAVFHKHIDKFSYAVFLSAVLSAIALQVINYLLIGYLDPFFWIAFPISIGIYAAVSIIIGKVIRKTKSDTPTFHSFWKDNS